MASSAMILITLSCIAEAKLLQNFDQNIKYISLFVVVITIMTLNFTLCCVCKKAVNDEFDKSDDPTESPEMVTQTIPDESSKKESFTVRYYSTLQSEVDESCLYTPKTYSL